MDAGARGSVALFAALVRTSGAHPLLLLDTLQSLALQSGGCLPVVIVEGDSESCEAAQRISAVSVCGVNAGLEYCLTNYPGVEFVFWLDEGDLAYPFFTQMMAAAFLASGADVVCAASNRRDAGRFVEAGCGICAVRTGALRNSGVRPSAELEQAGNWHFLIRMVQAGFRVHPLAATLSEARIIAGANQEATITDLRQRIWALENSLSWRWTAPIRRLLDALTGSRRV